MSTRGMIGAIINDELVFGAYNHADSYPDGLGIDMVNLIRSPIFDVDVLKTNISKMVAVSNDDIAPEELVEKYADFADVHVSTKDPTEWYVLLRGLQGVNYFYAILRGEVEHFLDSREFIDDSLFCEYAYILNLDSNTLECYEGFQKRPDYSNRFGVEANSGGYYPCKLVASISFYMINDTKLIEAYKALEE